MKNTRRKTKVRRKPAAIRSAKRRRKQASLAKRGQSARRGRRAGIKRRSRRHLRTRSLTAVTSQLNQPQPEHRPTADPQLLQLAATAGAEAGTAIRNAGIAVDKTGLQQRWPLWLQAAVPGSVQPDIYTALMRAYIAGACAEHPEPPDWVLLPQTCTVSCILTAMNEERTIGHVLQQLTRLALHEIIVVVNGSADRTRDIAETFERVKVLHYEEALGHDVGRTLGAKASSGELLLFMDADFAVPGESLLPFFLAVRNGADIVLNDISPFVDRFDRRDEVTVMKEFLNRLMNRHDLSVNSLTAVPHVMTSKAAWTIGLEKLAVPPLAQVNALEAGLRIETGGQVNVVKQNRLRKNNTGAKNPVADMIIGDHMEALSQLIKLKGPRLAFADMMRKRRR